MLALHASWFLRELNFSDPVGEFRGFIRSLNYELETGALLLSRTVNPTSTWAPAAHSWTRWRRAAAS